MEESRRKAGESGRSSWMKDTRNIEKDRHVILEDSSKTVLTDSEVVTVLKSRLSSSSFVLPSPLTVIPSTLLPRLPRLPLYRFLASGLLTLSFLFDQIAHDLQTKLQFFLAVKYTRCSEQMTEMAIARLSTVYTNMLTFSRSGSAESFLRCHNQKAKTRNPSKSVEGATSHDPTKQVQNILESVGFLIPCKWGRNCFGSSRQKGCWARPGWPIKIFHWRAWSQNGISSRWLRCWSWERS